MTWFLKDVPIIEEFKYFEHGLTNKLSTLNIKSHPPNFEHGLT